MTRSYIFIGFLVIAVVAVGLYWFSPSSSAPSAQLEPYVVPPLGEEYTNDTYNFSLSMPEGFTAREVMADQGETIVFENASGDGIQVLITPFDEDLRVLTKERIQADVPDMQITDEQPVEIGDPSTGSTGSPQASSGQVPYQGIAFKSDNPAFDGASREVWFVYPECSRGVCQNY